jgi:uncharacterized membrane protein
MKIFYLPFALTVGGMLLYHLSQKSVPKDINPFVAIVIAYAFGIIVCAICAFIYPTRKGWIDSARDSNWAVIALGAAAAAIEIGFLLSYRAGWKISVAAVASNVAAAVVLIPIGIIVYRDQLSARNVAGLILSILGLVLIMKK